LGKNATAKEVKKEVSRLSVDAWRNYTDSLKPVHMEWLRTAKKKSNKTSLIDFDGSTLSHSRLLTAAIVFSRKIGKRVKNEQKIGLLIPTSSGGIISNLAVLMLGKTVVNLNYI
jgi:acyl-[acyl-carrier-protein]-phospholipid O-acyltransferase/long-chain-fatty-acid--[acyl-carrier-protein] ligase